MTVVLTTTIQRFIGLAADAKPTPPAGSEFYETDSGATYVYDGSAWQLKAAGTAALLDAIVTILGTTKTFFWPGLESTGALITSYKNENHRLTATDAGSNGFHPFKHAGGVHSYLFTAAAGQHFLGSDAANASFASNAAFSMGAWILPEDITTVTILSKYDVNVQREYRLGLDGSSKIELEAYDESNNEDRTGASDTAVTADEWSFVVVTFDGADANGGMTFYLNGSADGTGNTESGAAWASLQGTTAPIVIGANLTTAPTVEREFQGRIALWFICGKELTAANVTALNPIGQQLLGLA